VFGAPKTSHFQTFRATGKTQSLRESLYDDAKGVVNIVREKEITDLANKLKNEKAR